MQNNYDTLLDTTKSMLLTIVDISPQWELVENKDGYCVYSRINPDNQLKINRTETICNHKARDVIDLVYDIDRRKQYDQNMVEGRICEKIDQNTNIFYAKVKAPVILVDPRDVVLLSRIYTLEDGSLMIVTKSIEYPQVPQIKGVVRAEMVFSTWIVKDLPNNQSKIVTINNMNLKGDIPKMVINQGSKQQAEGVKRVIAVLDKMKK